MKYTIDHDYHLHSYLSPCGNCPEHSTDVILDYAKKHKLSSICLTDHYWDEMVPTTDEGYMHSGFAHISKALPLPQTDGIRFLFGCECEMGSDFAISVPPSRYDDFDFIVIPTTHMHMKGLTIPEEAHNDLEWKARLWIERIDRLMDMNLPFSKIGLAHLATPLMHVQSREGFIHLLDSIPSDEIYRVFSRVSHTGCGIEINRDDFCFYEFEKDSILRMFRIAKECGCKFYLGSDAHNPNPFRYTIAVFERAINLLDLCEDDKFHIGGKQI